MSTGVYSGEEIRQGRKDGKIIIEPYHEELLNNASYNVRLGKHCWRSRASVWDTVLSWTRRHLGLEVLNPFHPEHVAKYWNSQEQASLVKTEEDSKKYGLPIGTEYFLLQPNELILGHTIEFIGGVVDCVGKMQARSSLGRCGVTVCADAGWGDIGYFNRWTMEIRNGLDIPLVLPVGQAVAQIIFHRAGSTSDFYDKKGSYQKSSDLKVLMENWTPKEMYPRATLKTLKHVTTFKTSK